MLAVVQLTDISKRLFLVILHKMDDYDIKEQNRLNLHLTKLHNQFIIHCNLVYLKNNSMEFPFSTSAQTTMWFR